MVGGNLNFANLLIDEIKTSGLSSDNGTLHIDVDPVKMTSDKLSVDGNVEGSTKLVVHAASNDDLNGKIVFAESVNDSTGNEKSFEISRVYKSPYMYEVKHQSSAENEHEWYFGTGTEENPFKISNSYSHNLRGNIWIKKGYCGLLWHPGCFCW